MALQQSRQFHEMMGYICATVLVLNLSSCNTNTNIPEPMGTGAVVFTPAAPDGRSIVTPTALAVATRTPNPMSTATPTVIAQLPTASRPVSEALFTILSDDQTKLLAAYEGEARFRVFYEIPIRLGKAQVISSPEPFLTLSSNGIWITVIENRPAGRSDVYRINTASRNIEPILTWAGPQFEASISPDGRRVAFISAEGECPEQKGYDQRYWCSHRHLYVMNTDGSDIKRLSAEPANRCFLSWSPTGAQLAYQEGCDPTAPSQIYLVTLSTNGNNKVQRVTQDGGDPSWSPNGKWLHWESVGNIQHVGLLNTSGDVVSQFDLGRVVVKTDIAWSSDSKQMAAVINKENSQVIQIWNLGNSVHEQDIIPLQNMRPSEHLKWLSDGNRFVLSGHKLDSNRQVADKQSWFIINLDGHLITEIGD